MNLGDFVFVVMLSTCITAFIVAVIVFGSIGLVIGIRRMIKKWW